MPASPAGLGQCLVFRTEDWLRRRYFGHASGHERQPDTAQIQVDLKELATVMASYIDDEVKALTKK